MNERIKELADQADLQPYYNVQEAAIKKFAELIVRECSKVNNQFIGSRIGEIDLDLVYKKHFGVK